MNKNTVIAMILSTVVVLASIFIQSKFFPNSIDKSKTESNDASEMMVTETESTEHSDTNLVLADESSDVKEEKIITITTKNE